MAGLRSPRRWVVKIGSALLTADGRGLDGPSIAGWVDQLAALKARSIDVLLVSSGSIAEGMSRLGLDRRPQALHELQALAAVGQMGLAQIYESNFLRHGIHTAQVLLTHDDFASRMRYLNARSTLRSLLAFGVVPVVNENDTVSTEQIALGDNDTLAGLVSNLMEAELMVVLTDREGLYSADPRLHPGAKLIREARAGDAELEAMAGEGGKLGRGGMRSKLKAAALAARSGTATRIAGGRTPGVLLRIADGEALGTRLGPVTAPMTARKRWMAGQVKTVGRLELDAGAVHVVRHAGKSLLPVGVRGVSGQFDRGEVVACFGPDGREVARGLVNYGAGEVVRILGAPSGQISELLGYVNEPELIHRDNLVMVD